ncbi:hypothetical protein B6D60_03540, partial [candidate division KSB1 bacterium 4484_87]
MKEMLDKLYHLITRDIFISDIIFFLGWGFLNYFRETFAMLARWGVLCCHLWANVKFHLIIRTKIASSYISYKMSDILIRFMHTVNIMRQANCEFFA